MPTRQTLYLMATVAAIAWAVTHAQTPGTGTKIAVCDVAAVFEQATITTALESKFKEQTENLDREAKAMQDDIRIKRQELAAFDPQSKDYRKREEALLEMEAKSEAWFRSRQNHLRRVRMEWFRKIYQQTVDSTHEIAQSAGIHVVLSDNPIQYEVPDAQALIGQIRQKNVIYASPHVDLTAQIVTRLNTRFEEAGGANSINIAI